MADVFNNNPSEYVDLNNLFPVLNERVGMTWQQFQALVENVNYVKNNSGKIEDVVLSVNGKTGKVLLSSSDVNAVAENTNIARTEYQKTIRVLPQFDSLDNPYFRVIFDSENIQGSSSQVFEILPDGINIFSNGEPQRLKANGQEIAFLSDVNGGGGGASGGVDLSRLANFVNKLYINMSKDTNANGLFEPEIRSSSNFAVDWGDGTDIEYFEDAVTKISHKYENTSFSGWVTFYGKWYGIDFSKTQVVSPKKAIIKADYDSNITSVGDYGFYNCSNLTNFYHKAVQSLSYGAFYGTALKSIDTSMISSIAQSVFGASFVGTIDLPLVTAIPNASLSNIPNVEIVCVPNVTQLTNVGGVKLAEIVTGKALTQITFSNINIPKGKCLRIVADSLVTATNAPEDKHSHLIYFVPCQLLGEYKKATNWVDVADKIYPDCYTYSETITIPVANWVDNAQTVEVVGSTAEARNVIEFVLVDANGNQIEDTYGLTATQGTMQMTFTCQTVPTEDIQVFVKSTLTNY